MTEAATRSNAGRGSLAGWYTPPLMNQVTFEDQQFQLTEYESVLDCLLRHGQAIPYACRAGLCQACLVKTVNSQASAESQRWIKPELRALGYTLACQWVPDADVSVALPDLNDFSTTARIRERTLLAPQVLCLRLEIPDPGTMFACRPGQYLNLINPQGVSRPYSIANDYEHDGYIELHIAATTHGVLSHWLFETATCGSVVHLRGPAGECYYREQELNATPLLLAGTGTGLAPLFGILQDALRKGHQARIDLFHGAQDAGQLYLHTALQELAQAHPNLHYHPCVRKGVCPPGVQCESIEKALTASLDAKTLSPAAAFLCGAPDFVHSMRKTLYLKGLRAQRIYSDPFTERQVVTTQSGGKT
ncbi:MAG TPA: 2Fe-2S iron-sulfur cluster binding domain-containing protein [Pseudomonadaceae bacterium]|nr:2Fe-2S iron-sulfur cluster binding domain-containing protein [Pseudomonadaceae bacterium]